MMVCLLLHMFDAMLVMQLFVVGILYLLEDLPLFPEVSPGI